MAFDSIIRDPGGTAAEVDANGALATTIPGYTAAGVVQFGGPEAGPAMFCENDPGEATGERLVRSPEVDGDFRVRGAHDTILDRETFNYSAQNTGKHSHVFTTLTATASASGLLLNSGNITTTSTGMTFGTHAQFPCGMGVTHSYFETSAAFSAALPPANVVVDIGAFQRGASTAFAPLDGAFFRFSSSGMIGVINRSGVETTTGVFNFTFEANHNYLLAVSITEKRVRFWIDDVLVGTAENHGAGQPFNSASLPWSVRQANVGAAGGGFQTLITDYTVSLGGPMFNDTLGAIGNRSLGSYQGLSGGTMGGLARYTNNTTTAAGAGTNTALIVGHSAAIGGEYTLTAQAGAAVDNIVSSYQVPAGTTAVQGKRLRIEGVKIAAANIGAAVATTATLLSYNLAFGHTTISLATAESASFATGTTKAARRIPLGMQSWAVGAAIGTTAPDVYMPFTNPVYVNPGEFIAVAAKFVVGTATALQAIYLHVTFDYGWEWPVSLLLAPGGWLPRWRPARHRLA